MSHEKRNNPLESEKFDAIKSLGFGEEITLLLLEVSSGSRLACKFATAKPLPDMTETGLLVKTVELTPDPLSSVQRSAIQLRLGRAFNASYVQEVLKDDPTYIHFVANNQEIARILFDAVNRNDDHAQNMVLEMKRRSLRTH